MFVVTVFFEVKPAYIEPFRHAMQAQAKNSLELEDGCRRFDVCIDPLNVGNIFFYELYEDEAAFKAHRETGHFKQFDAEVAPWTANKRVLTYSLLMDRAGGEA
jgi:quinol monooxygenase YgiN